MIYRKVKYKYSFDNKEPNVSSMLIGEIELNLSENNECLYLKTQEGKLAKLPLNGKVENTAKNLKAHVENNSNPHKVTQEQIGLSNVENHSDALRDTSTAEKEALNYKMNISDIYASLDDDGSGRDFSKLPLSASEGPIFVDTINIIKDNASGKANLEERITALENWN